MANIYFSAKMKPGDRICKCGRFQSECICVQKINIGSQEGEKTYSKREVRSLLRKYFVDLLLQEIKGKPIADFDQEKWFKENFLR